MPRVPRSCVAFLNVGALLVTSGSLALAGDSPEAAAFFESKIRPVLVQHCYQCHSTRAGKSEGGLRLDSRNAIRTGGDRGAAVVPGDTKKSVLLTAISHTDPDLKMPPKKERLAESVINDFKTWINSGAADPREEDSANAAAPPVTIEAGRRFWAFQKPMIHKAATKATDSGERYRLGEARPGSIRPREIERERTQSVSGCRASDVAAAIALRFGRTAAVVGRDLGVSKTHRV